MGKYYWTPGARISLDPDIACKELEKIRKTGGGVLTAHAVVSAATRANSPLHKHFEWDNDVAADKFRLEQGQHLFRCARVKVEGANQEASTLVRVYINSNNDGLYHTVAEIMGDADLRERALRKVMMELHAMQGRNAEFQQLFDVLVKAEQAVGDIVSPPYGFAKDDLAAVGLKT